jgi:hypothetical protein
MMIGAPTGGDGAWPAPDADDGDGDADGDDAGDDDADDPDGLAAGAALPQADSVTAATATTAIAADRPKILTLMAASRG